MTERKRILFVAENVTLAQVVRLAELAGCLDPSRYELHFASSEFPEMVFGNLDVTRHLLDTMDKRDVERALDTGSRIYDVPTIQRYVSADLEVIGAARPDFIVGDFRLSLSISAAVAGVPHATLINAYWSPYRSSKEFPVPDHPIIGWLGEKITAAYFPRALPIVFRHFAAPINTVRRQRGLPPLGSLQEVLTHGNYTLYPDTPALAPTVGMPSNHHYLGPVLWSPKLPLDSEVMAPDDERPLVYVTLGSSGKVALLPTVLSALADLPVRVIASTAGRTELSSVPSNVVVREFVPGDEVARRAALVISNGGSTTGYQALNQGTPVLGIASNLDQYLAMQAIERTGAGLLVKARACTPAAVRDQVCALLEDPRYKLRARAIREDFQGFRAASLFPAFLESACRTPGPALPNRVERGRLEDRTAPSMQPECRS